MTESTENKQAAESWIQHHAQIVWTHYATIMMGVWLLATVATFGAGCQKMAWSDALSGSALIILGFFSLSPHCLWAPWLSCLTGIWLQLAPLIFWSPTAFGYLNDTLVGVAVISLSLLIPGIPGIVEIKGNEIPLGWTYNPSSWPQRLPIIFLACICWFCARYMAAYQLGYINQIWDPIFHNGTLNVITSTISKAFPVSDAGLGAAAYTIEALMGCKGGISRWHTMPWMVLLFGILVVPVGLTSIILILLQPLVVGSWCFWCLLTAACMLLMVALTVDEVAATLQFLTLSIKQGNSFWATLWKGGTALGLSQLGNEEISTAPPTREFWAAAVRGISIHWGLAAAALLGCWLMFFTKHHQLIDTLDQVFGALIITLSLISMAEVTRSIRWLNLIMGIATASIPFFVSAPSLVIWNNLAIGIAVILLSIPRGSISQHYGIFDPLIL